MQSLDNKNTERNALFALVYFWSHVFELSFSLRVHNNWPYPNHPSCSSHPILHILKYCFCRSHFLVFVRIQNTFSRVNVVLNRTTVIVDSDCRFDNLCCSHLQSQSEMYHVSWWYYTLLIYILIGQLRRDVIGRLSVKPWYYWLWRLVISNWCVSIRLLSQLNSRLLLVKLSFLQSFSRS